MDFDKAMELNGIMAKVDKCIENLYFNDFEKLVKNIRSDKDNRCISYYTFYASEKKVYCIVFGHNSDNEFECKLSYYYRDESPLNYTMDFYFPINNDNGSVIDNYCYYLNNDFDDKMLYMHITEEIKQFFTEILENNIDL